jgi:hypothetical protein
MKNIQQVTLDLNCLADSSLFCGEGDSFIDMSIKMISKEAPHFNRAGL